MALSPRMLAHHRAKVEGAERNGRWSFGRKESLIALIDAGEISRAEAMSRFGFSDEELDEWRVRRAAFGVGGLQQTKLQAFGHVG